MGIHKFITNIIIISFTIGNIYDRIFGINFYSFKNQN